LFFFDFGLGLVLFPCFSVSSLNKTLSILSGRPFKPGWFLLKVFARSFSSWIFCFSLFTSGAGTSGVFFFFTSDAGAADDFFLFPAAPAGPDNSAVFSALGSS
jgi:hypothetical protein